MRRPLFWFTVHFAAVVALTLWLGGASGLIATCGGIICCTLLPGARARKGLTLCLASSLALGLTVSFLTQQRLADWRRTEGQTLAFTGWVQEQSPYAPGRVTVRGEVPRGGKRRRMTLDLTGTGEELLPGQWIAGSIRVLEARQNGEAPGGVSLFGAAAEEPEVVPAPGGFHLTARLAAIRWELSRAVQSRAPGRASALVAAMVFSRQELLDRKTLEMLSRAGIRHLIVVSGLHLSILVGWVRALCRRGGMGEQGANLAAVGAVWLAAGLAGFSVSVLRAAGTVSLWLAGQCLGRRSDGLTSLAAAALVLTAVSPPVVFSAGWQLTFAATLGILLGEEPLAGWMREKWESRFGKVGRGAVWLCEGMAATLCAQTAVMPVLAWTFGTLPLWGTLANLLVMPFVTGVILLGGLGSLLLFAGASGAAGVLLAAARGLGWCILGAAEGIARLPGGAVPVRFWYELVLCFAVPAALFGAAALSGRVRPRYLRAFCWGAAALLAAGFLWSREDSRGRVLAGADRRTGAVVVSAGGGTVAVAAGEGSYARRVLSDRLLRGGAEGPLVLVFAGDAQLNPTLWWLEELSPEGAVVPAELLPLLEWQRPGKYFVLSEEGAEVLPGVWVRRPAPEILCIDAAGKRVVNCLAGYGLVTERDLPPGGDLLVDMDGRVYPLTGRIRRMWDWEGLWA